MPSWVRMTANPADLREPATLYPVGLAQDRLNRRLWVAGVFGNPSAGGSPLALGNPPNVSLFAGAGFGLQSFVTPLTSGGDYLTMVNLTVRSAFGPVELNGIRFLEAGGGVRTESLLKDTPVMAQVPDVILVDRNGVGRQADLGPDGKAIAKNEDWSLTENEVAIEDFADKAVNAQRTGNGVDMSPYLEGGLS